MSQNDAIVCDPEIDRTAVCVEKGPNVAFHQISEGVEIIEVDHFELVSIVLNQINFCLVLVLLSGSLPLALVLEVVHYGL